MHDIRCPICGHETTDAICAICDQATVNGAAKPSGAKPPPEVANWVIEPVPPEIAEHFRRTFNESEYLAEVRELERTGGVQIDDLIAELERKVNGSL